jgi:hypothetical protein
MKYYFTLISLILFLNSYAEKIPDKDSESSNSLNYQELIIPITLITYGFIGIESDFFKFYNYEIKEEVGEHIDGKVTIDDFSQYAPFASVYLLNSFGIEGKHNLKDRTIILGTAYLIMGATVNSLKLAVDVTRPDGSSNNSFPSGHTATAFMGAEFLYQEYKDVSLWYGVAGYSVALGTGIFRMVNERHWLTDVATGAGFGMLSTKISYYIFDKYIKHDKHTDLGINYSILKDEVWLSLNYKF